jgi:hypothetical protein
VRKENCAVVFHQTKAQFAQPTIPAEEIPAKSLVFGIATLARSSWKNSPFPPDFQDPISASVNWRITSNP